MSASKTYLIFLGPPGSGKGTQSRMLQDKLGIPQISTGDLFRYNLKNKTELGLLAKRYMDAGELVPDEVTIRMVEERLSRSDCAHGAIFDGFPRNLHQAVALDEMLQDEGGVSLAPLLLVDDSEVIRRLSGRRVCRSCGAVYHVEFKPPKIDGVCDIDGGELYQRDDDKPETIKHRLYVYYRQTSPLVGYYFAKGLLAEINGNRPPDEVQQALIQTLAERHLLSETAT
ncbi:MAG: adenylate kinase [Chloroflexi bacterium]|nr:adenylate kinase [Chloroflexota bacterium]